MDPKGVGGTVFVIAGSWDCSEKGIWDFVVAKDCYARSIEISEDMTYEELLLAVSAEFGFDGEHWMPKLSYWLPGQLSVFAVNTRPPVGVTSTMGLQSFLRVKQVEHQLNLLVSMDGVIAKSYVLVGATEKSASVVTKGKGVFVESSDIETVGVIMSTYVSEQDKARSEHENGRIGSSVDRGVAESLAGEPILEDWQCTNTSGIIRLADAATPTFSEKLMGSDSGEAHDDIGGYTDEDERVLREVEEIERLEQQGLQRNGKGIICESSVYAADSDNEEAQSDGFGVSDSDDDESYNFQYWADLIDRENQVLSPGNRVEVGQPSTNVDPQDADLVGGSEGEEGSDARAGEDISAAVFSYSDLYKSLPLSLENIYEDINEQGTLPTTDAQSVFDNVEPLTNINGCATVSAEEDAIYIGHVFRDKEDLQTTLAVYAIKRLFHFRQTRSDPSRVICVCVDPNCRWRVYAHVVSKHSNNFEIRTATLTHTCTIAARALYGKQASSKVIASVLAKRYGNGLPGPRAVDIPDIVLAEMKVSVTYMKAWYAKETAIIKTRGSEAGSYKLLAGYMHLLELGNKGTKYKLEHTTKADGTQQFKYLFFSLGASIAGIKYMRKLISVDGMVIKAKFKGVLVAASMQDANFQVFPVAFGIVDGENDAAWTWFFKQLSTVVPDGEDLVIVSDRHRSIYAAIGKVYPKAFHGACAVHIERNVRAKFPGTGLSNVVGRAARAFNVGDFNDQYTEISRRSKRCYEYLEAIPKEHWTQAYCPARRYNVMSSNIAEALNSVLAKLVELPIVTLIDGIRVKLMRWFCLRRAESRKQGDVITPYAHKYILKEHIKSAGLPVIAASAWTYQVNAPDQKTYYVDLEAKTCSCLQFQKVEIPCAHAIAAARINGVHIPNLAGPMYGLGVWANSYAEIIIPVPNECEVDIPAVVTETQYAPPVNPRGPGRQRKRRIPSIGENVGGKKRKTGSRKCGVCSETGHNRATCQSVPS